MELGTLVTEVKKHKVHWKEYDVTETYNPPIIQKVRMDLNGVFPENCKQCKERESNGTRSHTTRIQ